MRPNNLKHGAALACGILLLVGLSATADDKDKPALSGTWAKKEGEMKLKFADKDALTIFPHGDKLEFEIVCSYTVTKEGLVKTKITGLEGREDVIEKAKGSLPVGLEFQFKWKAKGDTATIDGLEGKDVDHLKAHLEGDYAKKD